MSDHPATLFQLRDLYAHAADPNTAALTRHLSALEGIGPSTEATLTRAGIDSWFDLADNVELLGRGVRKKILEAVARNAEAVSRQDVQFFTQLLTRREHWRIAAAFPHKTAFFDIETTGLSHHYHRVTVIGWILGGRYKAVVGDPTEAVSAINDELTDDTVLVTYNGAHFDLPFLARHAPGLRPPPAHVDLRHLAQRVGLTGGQKKIEKQIGVRRAGHIKSVRGEAAPGLWFKYTRGELDALRELIEYNHADVDGLQQLLSYVVQRLDGPTEAPWPHVEFADWMASEGSRPDGPVRHYTGESGPRIRGEDLEIPPGLRVVGIDLTGNEKRATGWAATDGMEAVTRRINTDDDLIGASVAFDPDVISIDAPLSLPRGRLNVEDTDPGRARYGISRYAERELWRRGVRTYPALIQSMQRLTARGIDMAARFRSLGIPVIESFPGAMQDVLGMPRKGLSVSELKESLAQYGLRGPYLTEPISHDEIDALSSAIVAHFFVDGRYEALGDDAEEPMIIPALEVRRAQRPPVVAVAGRVGAGKTTFANLLQDAGFARTRFSEVLLRTFPNSSALSDREHLRSVGRTIHQEGRQRWLARTVLDGLPDDQPSAIDGVRYPDDYALLFEEQPASLRLVYIDIDDDVRARRYRTERPDGPPLEQLDLDEAESHQSLLRERASIIVDNSGDLHNLRGLVTRLRAETDTTCH